MTVLLTHMAPDPTEADENQVVPQWPSRVRARTGDGGEVLALWRRSQPAQVELGNMAKRSSTKKPNAAQAGPTLPDPTPRR